MFQPDPNQWPAGASHSILPPHFIGRVPPLRRDAALALDLETQMAQCAAMAAKRKAARHLWRMLFRAARRAAGAVGQAQHGRFGLGHLRGALK